MDIKMKIIGLIPSRINSSRLPQKPLLEIEGIPLVIHTYRRAKLSKKLNDIFICCDDEKIMNIAKKFKAKLDPRKFNGAIFLGLKGPVVKSHGSTDAIGFYHSIDLCYRIIKGDLMNKIKNNLSHGSGSK